jgi:hypothetical protein
VQFLVPDTRAPGFAEVVRRQTSRSEAFFLAVIELAFSPAVTFRFDDRHCRGITRQNLRWRYRRRAATTSFASPRERSSITRTRAPGLITPASHKSRSPPWFVVGFQM